MVLPQHPSGARTDLCPIQAAARDEQTGVSQVIRSFRNLLLLAIFGSVVLPPLALFTSDTGPWTLDRILILVVFVIVGLAALVGFHRLFVRFEPHILKSSQNQAAFLETISTRFLPLAIVGSAALSLFLELAVIRWQGTIFEFFAFYKNYGLLACFAGLGLGYALSRNEEGIPLSLTLCLLAWQFGLLMFLRFGLPRPSVSLATSPFLEQLSMGLQTSTSNQSRAVYLLLTVVFLLTALAFVPLGQVCGRLMEKTSQLSAYGLNLAGSLLGVSLMFLASWLWTPPVVWFGACFLALLFFFVRTRTTLLVGGSLALLSVMILAWPVNPLWNKVYSPYQMLEIGYSNTGLMLVRAAGHYYQRVQDLSTSNPAFQPIRNYYDLPYRVHSGPNDVAVVGAGTGNDVAAALRSGARHVDAIEIDPAILLAGRMNHPERPYSNSRVRPIVNDARSFFRNTPDHYDLIVYGLLDSHTLLSQASSVRLDSFVYTIEGLREARSRLKETGVLSLSFAILDSRLGLKIFQMMRAAFDGKDPLCIYTEYDSSVIFLESKNGDLSVPPALLAETHFIDASSYFRNSQFKVDISTDDWPFLYMPRRVYPLTYLITLGLVLLVSFVLYASFLQRRPQTSYLPFFFLGAGFMLVETKGITEMGLAFGNTWQVISIAIAGVLVMSFLANAVVHRWRVSDPYLPYLFLLLSLAVGWWIARAGGLPSTALGRIATVAILTCPLFFSGIVFSALLSAESQISSVMSMNLMGAMCGGVLEYNSMYFGFRFLYVLALALYAAALLSSLALRTKTSVVGAGTAALVSSPEWK